MDCVCRYFGSGKLVDDLNSSQFDLLVKVLTLPSFAWEFRHLLTLTNLQEVFDHLEEFILPKVLYLNFEGSGDTQAKEWVQSRRLSRIQVVSEAQIQEAFEEMSEGDVDDVFSLPLPARHDPQARLKRLWKLEVDGVSELGNE